MYPDTLYIRFLICYYFIFHCAFFYIKGHIYLLKVDAPFSESKFLSRMNVYTSITEREKEIILLILKGYSNDQIAKELFISITTVKTHNMNIFKKLGVSSRYNLILKFL